MLLKKTNQPFYGNNPSSTNKPSKPLGQLQSRRGMQKFGKVAQSTGKTSSFVQTFVNMFVHLRDLGAVSNRVELLTKDEIVTFVDDKTGIIIRIDKPKNWHTMTDKHKKGFIAEETQKQINLLLAQKHGYDIDQTPSGTHPSSSKGPDIVKHEEI